MDFRRGMSRTRLDSVLVDRGLVRSRASGRDLVRRGFVLVDGIIEVKASRSITDNNDVVLSAEAPRYVSRGAEKLVAALHSFGYDCAGRRVVDIGASTGGFTEILLKNGAREVFAVDVGRGQLAGSLAEDRRVHNLDGTDARKLKGEEIAAPIDALVCDVSFISLAKALPQPLMLVARGGWVIALIKPQFEVGPEFVGRDGVVRDPAAKTLAVDSVREWLQSQSGWVVDGVVPSPIAGGSGNSEYLIGARRDA